MVQAHCSDCGGYVELDGTGTCPGGHPRSCYRDVGGARNRATPAARSAPPQTPSPEALSPVIEPPGQQGRTRRPLLVVLAVAGVLLLCVGTLLAGAFVSGRMGGGRYPPYPKEPAGAYSPPTELQKRWALALSAVLTEQNNDRHDILAGVEGRPEQVMAVHDRLAYSWEIYTREDLLGTLEWIEAEGHRREFDRSAGQTGGKGIAAWDYGRYVALCRWGFAMGFLTEEEAWQRIMPVARLMQSVYPSWAEYGQSYVAGREYWSPDDGAASMVRSIESNLLSAPRSPWMQLPWDADLSTGADSR